MLMNILTHTPIWVFGIFALLVRLGMQQSKERSVTVERLILLPLAMLGLSFYGVWSTFDGSTLAILCWLGGALLTATASQAVNFSRNVRYVTQTRRFQLPGSWLPLALMMGIFFTKYAIGIVLAMHSQLHSADAFVAAVGLVYGFWSGMFFGRTAQIVFVHGRQAFA